MDADEETSFDYARRWAIDHDRFLSIIFDRFIMDAAWPQLDPLQRALDQAGEDIDLHQTARDMPKELGSFDSYCVFLNVRALAQVDAARPFLSSFMRVLHLAVERYLSAAPTETPRITAEDVPTHLHFDNDTWRRVALVLDHEPCILAGGTGYLTGEAWSRDISRSIRELRNVESVESYLAAQVKLLTPPAGLPSVSRPGLGRLSGVQLYGSSAPTIAQPEVSDSTAMALQLDELHPLIRDACASRFHSGHLADGVQQAAIALRDLVRKRSGLRAFDGADLMSRALSPEKACLLVVVPR